MHTAIHARTGSHGTARARTQRSTPPTLCLAFILWPTEALLQQGAEDGSRHVRELGARAVQRHPPQRLQQREGAGATWWSA